MRQSHDDQMRALRARLEGQSTPADKPVPDVPVQLTRSLVERAVKRSASASPLPQQLAWQQRTNGSMKTFLRHARTFQDLPHFARRMRE